MSHQPEMHICHAGLIDIALPILYEDTIMVSGKNLMDTKQLAADINSGVDSALNSITQDGVKLTLDNDGIILIDTSGVEVSSEEETFTKNFFLLGAWGTEKVMMFKEGYTYCISRPLVTDVSISFITHNPNDGYNVFKYIGGTTSNPYELYHCTEDIAVVGVYLSVKIKALFPVNS